MGRREGARLIRPARGVDLRAVGEVVTHLPLLRQLALREVKIRYAESVLGGAWAVLQPLALTLVFSVFARYVVDVDTGTVPYGIFAFSGLVPWTLFATGVGGAAVSVWANIDMVGKVYFPRLILPLATMAVALLDAVVATVVVVVVAAAFGIAPGLRLATFPLFLALATFTASAIGIGLAGIIVRFRDVRHAVPLGVQMLLFASPVIYPLSSVPERWRPIFELNPLAPALEGFRWAVIGATPPPSMGALTLSLAVSTALMLAAVGLFAALERSYADLV